MHTINMLSRAESVKGQGVGTAYREQVDLVTDELTNEFRVSINKFGRHDITHYHTVNPEFFYSIPFTRRTGITVGSVHFLPETLEESISLPAPIKKIFYRYVLNFYRKMDHLVTVNPDFIDKLEAYGIKREKISYIPNYVSTARFYATEERERVLARVTYGLSNERPIVLTVGQLQTRKGIFDFIELAKRMPDAQFVWAGDFSFGKISDGYSKVKQIRENPPKNVFFLGLVERNHMNALYNIADVMFLPSHNELFPMTILEAMSCGVPILLRTIPVYESILFDFYLKGSSVDEFEFILRKLFENDVFRVTAQNRSSAGAEFYSREQVASQWRSLYNHLIDSREENLQSRKKSRWVTVTPSISNPEPQ